MRKAAFSFALFVLVFSIVFGGQSATRVAAANDFADPAFNNVWTRTDSLVGSAAQRSYYWGPAPISAGLQEPFNGKTRLVQYFDKSRMEINDPSGDKSKNFYITNGLLAKELITGKQQIGDNEFKDRWPAAIPLASDPDDGNAPTYYSFRNALDNTTDKSGQTVNATIDVDGKTDTTTDYASDANGKISYYEKTTGHNIPAGFWNFLNAEGLVVNCTPAACNKTAPSNAKLSDPWFYASGYPISEAFWAKTKIAGKANTPVMIQAFERRILTYVPSLDKAYQVQMGNIGQHYYAWLYQDAGKPSDYFTFQPGGATDLTAGGATFPDPLYQKWFAEYKAKYGVSVNYQAKGSGFGVQNLQNKTLDFGGTDAPMSDAELAAAKGGPVVHVPTCLGAVVAIYNIPSYNGTLKLDGDTLAKIYLGKITNWNDAAITALNGGAVANGAIQVVHRADSSGTTFVFTSYLAAVSSEWKSGPGASKAPNWPAGQGQNGNGNVAGTVNATPFSIGYVEIAFAKQNNLKFAQLKNKDGNFVTADLASVNAAAANIGDIPADLRFSLINEPGANSYPITSATWQIVYKNQTDKGKAIAVKNLLNWELTAGQSYNESLFYGKLPPNLRDKALQIANSIVTP